MWGVPVINLFVRKYSVKECAMKCASVEIGRHSVCEEFLCGVGVLSQSLIGNEVMYLAHAQFFRVLLS